jgi:hypothetical protein
MLLTFQLLHQNMQHFFQIFQITLTIFYQKYINCNMYFLNTNGRGGGGVGWKEMGDRQNVTSVDFSG